MPLTPEKPFRLPALPIDAPAIQAACKTAAIAAVEEAIWRINWIGPGKSSVAARELVEKLRTEITNN